MPADITTNIEIYDSTENGEAGVVIRYLEDITDCMPSIVLHTSPIAIVEKITRVINKNREQISKLTMWQIGILVTLELEDGAVINIRSIL